MLTGDTVLIKKAKIKSVASYLPDQILSNESLAEEFPEWSVDKIFDKTGIKTRRIAAPDETCSSMAVNSCRNLFETNNISPESIDYILLCTQSPDYKLPTTACIVQRELGIPTNTGALDFNLGCSGYVYGLSLAKGLIETGQSKRVLLVTSEIYSRYINKRDKSVRTLFGDAATATLIEATNCPDEQISSFIFGSDGNGENNLIVPHGGSKNGISSSSFLEQPDNSGNYRAPCDLYMNGSEILTFTLKSVPKVVDAVLNNSGLNIQDIDKVVYHQANKFMLEKLRKKSKFTEEQFLLSYEDYGNTVSSTIPLGLEKAFKENKLQPNDKVLLCGFGVGYSWAGCLIKW